MSKASARLRLREALERAGSAWILRIWGKEAEKNLDRVNRELDEFVAEYQRRFGPDQGPDPFALLEENPSKAAAFFQIETLMVSAEMKVMIWRILMGCTIAKVAFQYEAGKPPTFLVTLAKPYDLQREEYVGRHPADFRVLRHFGITGYGDQVYLEGYYAARNA
jgi:hypothetical protein